MEVKKLAIANQAVSATDAVTRYRKLHDLWERFRTLPGEKTDTTIVTNEAQTALL